VASATLQVGLQLGAAAMRRIRRMLAAAQVWDFRPSF
jgi:hypothetical protein